MSAASLGGNAQGLPGMAAWRAEAGSAVQQLADASAHTRETALASLSRLCAALPRYTAGDAAGQNTEVPGAGRRGQEGDAEKAEGEYKWLSSRLLELLAQGQASQGPGGELQGTASKSASLSDSSDAPAATSSPGSSAPVASSSAGGVPGVHKSAGWEARQGAFLGSKALLEHWRTDGARDYCGRLAELAKQSVDDEEARVRCVGAERMRPSCHVGGGQALGGYQ